jgi:SAM-dependent methyltransferase
MHEIVRPYSEACDQNKQPILAVLRECMVHSGTVLEIGSGTGQHAVHFARHLPHLTWQPSDVQEYLAGMQLWLDEAELPNVRPPLALDVTDDPWPIERADYVFSANTAHIMSWPEVEKLVAGVAAVLTTGGLFCLYGPFSYAGRHTSESNVSFDAWLKMRDPQSGVRDFVRLDALATEVGLDLNKDYAMPANNRTLVWSRG